MLYLYVCRLASGGAEKKLAEPPPASEAVMPLYLPLTMRLNPLWCFVYLMLIYIKFPNYKSV